MGTGIFNYIKYIIECIGEVIYPYENKCVICEKYIEEDLICKECFSSIKKCSDIKIIEKGKDCFPAFPTCYYSGIMMELILNLKYKGDFKSGEVIANLMCKKVKEVNINTDIITFVPSSKKSYKKRGYNQSEYLAKIISKNINVPIAHCLKKYMNTKDQIGLNGLERWLNVENSFKVYNEKCIKNKKVLLIDDVLTTGATSFYCANELKKRGAKEIFILTAAKSDV
ncbi:ComF family protein [Clostridium botulinum]|uniref:ComF family protein n=1 Tax=Clostridium botulinum TaxID=1491 RepID=A0A6G4HTX6_CLOBO|nr:ComF family protein [Clostridium botulinum]MBD5588556.1 ComF family protein [Clostridium botulinum]MBO0570749.1 ComF family protein [Clostridium botulinum]MBO0581129.1 ComF family protein [Clostridium botulinum]NFJ61297.1 ComF family protein [Clostridium botulinum]NFJ68997.1 ComF family protein [Clostridium botulinum]